MSVEAQKTKVVMFQGPETVASNATSATTVDTLGWEYATVDVFLEPAAATNSSNKWTSLVLTHGTTTDATNHTNISGAVGTTNTTAAATEFVLPAFNDTAAAGLVRFHVDLRHKERILRVVKQAPSTTVNDTANVVTLSRGKTSPGTTASDHGAGAVVFV